MLQQLCRYVAERQCGHRSGHELEPSPACGRALREVPPVVQPGDLGQVVKWPEHRVREEEPMNGAMNARTQAPIISPALTALT